jgi:hypothetical protein
MLPVQFGDPNQFCTDYINFVVADFEGTYHAILGRPALTKFMAISHYSYLVLKMPTEQGIVTLRGNVYTAYTCEEESFKVAEATNLSKSHGIDPGRRLQDFCRPAGDPRAPSSTKAH